MKTILKLLTTFMVIEDKYHHLGFTYTAKKAIRLVASCQFCRLVATCQQVITSLSISPSCNKSVTNCQKTCSKPVDKKFGQSTCNKSVDNLQQTSHQQAVASPCKRILISACCNRLLQDVNRLVVTCVFVTVTTW